MSFDQLEQSAEAQVAARLAKYTVAALTIGVVFVCILLGVAFMLFSAGVFVGALVLIAAAAVMLWLVALLRAARASTNIPPAP